MEAALAGDDAKGTLGTAGDFAELNVSQFLPLPHRSDGATHLAQLLLQLERGEMRVPVELEGCLLQLKRVHALPLEEVLVDESGGDQGEGSRRELLSNGSQHFSVCYVRGWREPYLCVVWDYTYYLWTT